MVEPPESTRCVFKLDEFRLRHAYRPYIPIGIGPTVRASNGSIDRRVRRTGPKSKTDCRLVDDIADRARSRAAASDLQQPLCPQRPDNSPHRSPSSIISALWASVPLASSSNPQTSETASNATSFVKRIAVNKWPLAQLRATQCPRSHLVTGDHIHEERL